MPAWLVPIVVQIAVKFGVPWLLKVIPGIPQVVIDIINDLLNKLADPTQSNSAAKKDAIDKIKKCTGSFCPPDVKE